MATGFACELVHKEKHADASSVRHSLYLSERIFAVFVFLFFVSAQRRFFLFFVYYPLDSCDSCSTKVIVFVKYQRLGR